MRRKIVVSAPDGSIYLIPVGYVLCVHGDRRDSPYHVRPALVYCDYQQSRKAA